MSTLKLPMKPSNFLQLGLRCTNNPAGNRNSRAELAAFRSYYAIKPSHCSILWGMILQKDLAPGARPIHLLMGLHFIKVYATDKAAADHFGVHEDTYRKWSSFMVNAIGKLKPNYIKWENRLCGENRSNCKVSVDGTDFQIPQQMERKVYYSHKFKKSGYRYEIALCIATGDVVWTNGPYPCGANPDINIFRRSLKKMLRRAGEKALADLGYRGEPNFINTPNHYDSNAVKKVKKDAGMRHETVNKRLKQFSALKNKFRHSLLMHKPVFDACITLVQMELDLGEPLYQVMYGKAAYGNWRANRRQD